MSDSTLPTAFDPHDQPTQSDLAVGASCPVVQRIGDYELLRSWAAAAWASFSRPAT